MCNNEETTCTSDGNQDALLHFRANTHFTSGTGLSGPCGPPIVVASWDAPATSSWGGCAIPWCKRAIINSCYSVANVDCRLDDRALSTMWFVCREASRDET